MKTLRFAVSVPVAACLLNISTAYADVNAKEACDRYRDSNTKANARWIEFKDQHEDNDSKSYWRDVALDLNDAALAVNDLAKEKGYPDNIQNAFVSYAKAMRGLAEAVNRQEAYDRLDRPLKQLIGAQQDVQKSCKQFWG